MGTSIAALAYRARTALGPLARETLVTIATTIEPPRSRCGRGISGATTPPAPDDPGLPKPDLPPAPPPSVPEPPPPDVEDPPPDERNVPVRDPGRNPPMAAP